MKIAVVGDIHTFFDAKDVEYFNGSDYDVILFVGDLPGRTHRNTARVGAVIAGVRKPAFLIPGNHDGVSVMQLIGEISHNRALIETSSGGQYERCRALEEALGDVVMTAYKRHEIKAGPLALDLVSARPHTMGGASVGYLPYLSSHYAVNSMKQSADKIAGVLKQCTNPVLILAHNGPAGLGYRRADIWGCDFRHEEGDFGDPDLMHAMGQAVKDGIKILGVAAGHMHHAVKGGGQRRWQETKDGILYVNAARVPRIFADEGVEKRHHVRLDWDGTALTAHEVLITL